MIRGIGPATAKLLIKHFGEDTLDVLFARPDRLLEVPGIGANAALYLSLVTAASRYYQVSRAMQQKVLNTIDKCGQYLLPFFVGRRNETVYMLCLDAKCKLLCCKEISEGSVNAAGISTRKVVEVALASNASTVVLAHNHPSGLAVPSDADVHTTYRVSAALDMVGVILADHIIVSDDDFVSLAQSGYFRPGQQEAHP